MINRMRIRLLHRLQLRESWVIFFIMGIIMLNFPFLQIFNRADTVFGFPLLFLYFTLGWAVSIAVIYLFTISIGHNNPIHHEKKDP
jgi:energy-coupling factor transporter transmembrane protein EcfT